MSRPNMRPSLFIILLAPMLFIATPALAEIPSKGKHTHVDAQQTAVDESDMPRFAENVANVTVSIGRDALLSCVVENLKSFKVAWVRVDTQTILSIHHNVITQNNRISLTYNDHRSWYLHIKEVEETDRGWYLCQVNTDPMRSKKGYLQVVVPPMIVEGMTSNDMVVREGQNVSLMCKARGYPEPYVMWRREDGEEMLIGGEHVNVVDGELLHITKVSRLHMAAYLCVASNGVPPSISKRVQLRVQFPPMLSIPNQLEGAYVGQDVILECHTEAYPASINYWTTERGDMIISDTSRAGDKYETTSTVSGYSKYMKLKIRAVGPNDFGTYRCVAKNSLGETDGNIKLDEMPAPTTAIISESKEFNRSIDGKRRHRNKFDSANALPDYGVEEWRDGAQGNNNHIGNTDDNNQTPVRNPPGAFHNSAGSLAQHNLLGNIMRGIKTQSFGIFKRLSSYLPAAATAAAAATSTTASSCWWRMSNIKSRPRYTPETIVSMRQNINSSCHNIGNIAHTPSVPASATASNRATSTLWLWLWPWRLLICIVILADIFVAVAVGAAVAALMPKLLLLSAPLLRPLLLLHFIGGHIAFSINGHRQQQQRQRQRQWQHLTFWSVGNNVAALLAQIYTTTTKTTTTAAIAVATTCQATTITSTKTTTTTTNAFAALCFKNFSR